MDIDFETVYSQKYRVHSNWFTRSLMLRCCHCWTRPLVLFLILFRPSVFEQDFRHLDTLRRLRNRQDFAAEIKFIKYYNRYELPRWRKTLQIWPSTRKLLRYSDLLPEANVSAAAPSPLPS